MYRRCNTCCCNNSCGNMHCNEESLSEALEDVCDDYANMSAFDTDEDEENECGCGYESNMHMFPDNLTLAQSYVPMQYLDKTFKPCIGLKHGTIFPELVSPYKPCQSIEEIEFIKATNTMGKGCSW